MPEQIGDILKKMFPQNQLKGQPAINLVKRRYTRSSRPGPRPPGLQVSEHLGAFAAVPYNLIDLGSQLAKRDETRGLSSSFKLVILDLMRYTDWSYGDVVVSNGGICRRNRISLSSVKAIIAILKALNVLVKAQPSEQRKKELQKSLRGGFNSQKRYMVWQHHSEWYLPRTPEAIQKLAAKWTQYRGKSKNGMQVVADGIRN